MSFVFRDVRKPTKYFFVLYLLEELSDTEQWSRAGRGCTACRAAASAAPPAPEVVTGLEARIAQRKLQIYSCLQMPFSRGLYASSFASKLTSKRVFGRFTNSSLAQNRMSTSKVAY